LEDWERIWPSWLRWLMKVELREIRLVGKVAPEAVGPVVVEPGKGGVARILVFMVAMHDLV
jgi:hypothetical protein